MNVANKKQYTSEVTEQYKEQTSDRSIRYTIEENIETYPEILNDFIEWKSKQKVLRIIPTFKSVMHENFLFPLFDIRNAEIREDWGQRNALLEEGRKAKILSMAKNFDPKLFEPISVDYIASLDIFIIRDGGGRSHAAMMNGIFHVPAIVRYVSSADESRNLFMTQDKNSATISKYDKFLQDLADINSARHNKAADTFALAKSSGISLHNSHSSVDTPLIEGLGILQKMLGKDISGDPKGTKWGHRSGSNIVKAIDVIKEVFPKIEEIPVSTLYALTAFIHMSQNRIPSGNRGHERLVEFISRVKQSDSKLSDLNSWVTVLKYDSSNNYGTYGTAALMRKWNEVFKMANKGKKAKGFYKFVTWTDVEIDIISRTVIPFARDESLYK